MTTVEQKINNAIIDQRVTDDYSIYHADTVDVARMLPSDSVHFSVFSPPFETLYTYSNSDRDMGNSASSEEFWTHYRFLIAEQFRVMRSGRLVAIHCMNLPTSKVRDGHIGIRDFRGEIIREYQSAGFIYHSEVCIWKDPVVAMQRTKALGLLHKQLQKDSTLSRQGIPDFLVVMRKPGDNENPVTGALDHYVGDGQPAGFVPVKYDDNRTAWKIDGDGTPIDIWQRYASPVWMDINQTNTLQYQTARDSDDERHICIARGSLVLTRRGYVPIQTVNVGDLVLTHKGRWRPVLAKRCNGVNKVVKVKAQGVPHLVCTPDHKLYARMSTDSVKSKASAERKTPSWEEAKDTLGSYLNLKSPPVESSPLTEKECWIIGRWLGDGHRGVIREGHGRAPIVLSCSHDESIKLIEILGDNAGSVARMTATQILVKGLSQAAVDVIEKCGRGASNKKIPVELMCLEKKKAIKVLEGYFSADGHVVESVDKQMASSVSRALLLGIAVMVQSAHGRIASVYAGRSAGTTEIEGRTVNTKQDWIFTYRRNDGYRTPVFIDDDGAWKKVRQIQDHEDAEVWDLQVDEDQSFIVEGCVVHNCPLQLDVIERAIQLWTNPGEVVWSPFMGIASEGYVSVQQGRKFIGAELKASYFALATRNMEIAQTIQGDMFA